MEYVLKSYSYAVRIIRSVFFFFLPYIDFLIIDSLLVIHQAFFLHNELLIQRTFYYELLTNL